MNLSKDLWYTRLFFWCLEVCDIFTKYRKSLRQRYRNGTNLCHFMRVILIYTPLILLAHLVIYGSIIYGIGYIIRLAGGLQALEFLGVLLLVVCVIVIALIAIVAISIGFDWCRNTISTKYNMVKDNLEDRVNDVNIPNPSGTILALRYVKSFKDRTCPVINFKENDNG